MRRILSIGALCLLVACGEDSNSVFSPSGVSGTYNLTSVNGVALPATVTGEDDLGNPETVTFTAGSLTLQADGTHTSSVTAAAFGTDTGTGTYTLVGTSTINFVESDGETFSGTLSGNRITIFADALTFIFEK